jgi:hypothetical protein
LSDHPSCRTVIVKNIIKKVFLPLSLGFNSISFLHDSTLLFPLPISYFAAFIVLWTNYGIDTYLARSAQYEKHHSLDSQERSIFLRMLLLKLINTGLPLSLSPYLSDPLISGALFLFASFFAQVNALVGVSTPSTGEFTTSWYQSVGVGIVLVQIGDIVSPHLSKV